MSHLRLALLLASLAGLLLLLGCFQRLPRPEYVVATEVPTTHTAVPTPTPEPIPTAPPEPAATPVPISTPEPIPTQTPEPTADIAFFLDLRQPDFNSTVPRDSVTVLGFTKPGALVEIKGIRTVADANGRFEQAVPLSPGINVIEVIASDGAGGQLRKFRQITYAPPTPSSFFLLVIEPANLTIVAAQPIRVAGRTRPGILITVNGVAVAVDELGQFETMVQLEPGPNSIDVIARTLDGQSLRSTISVRFTPQ